MFRNVLCRIIYCSLFVYSSAISGTVNILIDYVTSMYQCAAKIFLSIMFHSRWSIWSEDSIFISVSFEWTRHINPSLLLRYTILLVCWQPESNLWPTLTQVIIFTNNSSLLIPNDYIYSRHDLDQNICNVKVWYCFNTIGQRIMLWC